MRKILAAVAAIATANAADLPVTKVIVYKNGWRTSSGRVRPGRTAGPHGIQGL